MKFKKLTIVFMCSILISLMPIHVNISDYFMTAIFTVMGIMFSIGMGIMITFNFNGIRNVYVITKIRRNIKNVQDSFICYFSFSTIIYILEYILRDMNLSILKIIFKNNEFTCNFSYAAIVFLLFSAAFFIANFLQLQKLNYQIFDEINKK